MLSKAVCALGMVQKRNYAALRDARIKLRKEDYELSTGQRSNRAAMTGVQTTLSKEECA